MHDNFLQSVYKYGWMERQETLSSRELGREEQQAERRFNWGKGGITSIYKLAQS